MVVHTGQHYDRRMSEEILDDLGFPAPDYSLGVGSGTHGAQTGKVLIAFEEILLSNRPAVVVVAGDVNSTLACALAAAKLGIPIVHLEAGLRSGDWAMPEEINRVLTDRLSDLLLTHSPEAEDNLAREGVDVERVRFVGNTMIDSLRRFEGVARSRAIWRHHGVEEREYILVTLHRPSNVDDPAHLTAIVNGLCSLASEAPVLFPVHPRTRARLAAHGAIERLESTGVRCLDPVGYSTSSIAPVRCRRTIVTDFRRRPEEASTLGVACYTLRANTRRPITISHGQSPARRRPGRLGEVTLSRRAPTPYVIPLWDQTRGHVVRRDPLAAFPEVTFTTYSEVFASSAAVLHDRPG